MLDFLPSSDSKAFQNHIIESFQSVLWVGLHVGGGIRKLYYPEAYLAKKYDH